MNVSTAGTWWEALDSSAMLITTDRDGIIVSVNERFCETTRFSRQELIGHNARILASGHHSREHFERLWGTILSGSTWKGALRNRRKDGSLYWADVTISPLPGAGGRIEGFLSIQHDVTDQKKIEEHQAEASRQRGIQLLSEGFAHEINNPLTVALGTLRLMAGRLETLCGEKDCCSEEIGRIERSMSRIKGVVDSLRRVSATDLGDGAEIDVRQLVEDARIAVSGELASKGIEFRSRLDSSPALKIGGAPRLLSQVLVSILANATEAIASGPTPADNRWIEIESENRGSQLILRISNGGPAIPEELRPRIFEPFFSTKPPAPLRGLSLSVCRKIAEQHYGRLYLDELSPFTTFALELPTQSS